jgi:prepilin signal peptidase PulO-like enzyme (type II secretory pathway)
MESAWRWVPILGWAWTRHLVGTTLYPTVLARATAEEKAMIPIWSRWSFLRPLTVEAVAAVGLPALAWYYHSGLWLGDGFRGQLIPDGTATVWVWFGFHGGILALLLIAALIDWDERTIPDQVTTTGLVGALVVLAVWPAARLPNIDFSGLSVSRISPLNVFSPTDFSAVTQAAAAGTAAENNGGPIDWTTLGPGLDPAGSTGLLTAMLCWSIWAILILPSLCTLRFGWRKGLWLAWASVLQPRRRTLGPAVRPRRINPVSWVALVVWVFALGVCVATWSGGNERWEAIYSLSLSMALAGLGTWGVRLLAGWVMGREALGFGDVTLMFMIGAAFGWQFALLVFALAPILAISYALFRMIIAGDNALAFGPWLAAAAGLVLVGWYPIWHDFSRQSIFAMGPLLLGLIAVCLGLMPVALLAMLGLKRVFGIEQS